MKKYILSLLVLLSLYSSAQIKQVLVGYPYNIPYPHVLNFTVLGGSFVQSPTGSWGTSGSGVASESIPANTNTFISAALEDTLYNKITALGFDLNSTNVSGLNGNWAYTVYTAAVNTEFVGLYSGYGQVFASGIYGKNGDSIGLRRTGSTITCEHFRQIANGGTGAWVAFGTFATTTNALLYIKGEAGFANGAGHLLRNPRRIY